VQAVNLSKPPTNRSETQNGSATQGSLGQGLTMVQAEKMLRTLVEEGWFEKSRRGYYSLTPRALMELRGWLMETYNDVGDDDDEEDEETVIKVKLCFACKEIITTGQRCPKRTCPCRLHDICTQNFFRTQKARKCPLCSTDWTGNDFVGERSVTSKEKDPPGRRRRVDASTGRRSAQMVVEEAEESDDAEDGEEAGEPEADEVDGAEEDEAMEDEDE